MAWTLFTSNIGGQIDNRVVLFLVVKALYSGEQHKRGVARGSLFMQGGQHEFHIHKGSFIPKKKKRNSCNRAQLLTIRITRGWGITCWRPVPQQCIKTSTNGVLHGSNPKMTELSTLEANSRETAWPLFCPGYGYGLFDLLARLSDVSLCTIIEAPDMATSFTQLQVQR